MANKFFNNLLGTGSEPPTPINIALASNGSTASASDSTINGAPSTAIDGIRHTSGSWAAATGYASNLAPTVGVPVTFDVDFGSVKTIVGINVFALGQSVNYATDPNTSETSEYAPINFSLQRWSGGSWATMETVTANDKARRDFTYSPVAGSKVRLNCTSGGNARLFVVELEVWGY